MATVLRRLKLKRVSLVDSPANLEARVVLFKHAEKYQPTGPEVNVDEMVTCKSCGEKVKKADKCSKCGASMVSKEDVMDEKLKADLEAANAKLAEATAKIEALTAENAGLQKRLDTPEEIEKRKLEALPESVRKQMQEDREEIQKLRAEKSEAELAEVVKAEMPQIPGKPEDTGKLLKRMRDVVKAEDFEALTTMLKAASAQIETGKLFREVGKGGNGEPPAANPMARIEQLAAELISKQADLKKADAIARVIEMHPELYGAYSKSVMANPVPRNRADAE